MEKKFNLFWDVDDTFIITNEEYVRTNLAVAKMILSIVSFLGITLEEITKLHKEINLRLVTNHGFATFRYPLSWVETYNEIVKTANPSFRDKLNAINHKKNQKEIEDLVNGIFERKFVPYPKLHETLDTANQFNLPMHVLTAGDEHVQHKRLHDADIFNYFNEVHVVQYKNPSVYKNVLRNRKAEQCIMIGNSLKSDVFPALDNGSYAIHIARDTWELDHYPIDQTHPKYFQVQELHEVPSVIEKIIQSV